MSHALLLVRMMRARAEVEGRSGTCSKSRVCRCAGPLEWFELRFAWRVLRSELSLEQVEPTDADHDDDDVHNAGGQTSRLQRSQSHARVVGSAVRMSLATQNQQWLAE